MAGGGPLVIIGPDSIKAKDIDALTDYAMMVYSIDAEHRNLIATVLQDFVVQEEPGSDDKGRKDSRQAFNRKDHDDYYWNELPVAGSDWDKHNSVIHVKKAAFHLVIQLVLVLLAAAAAGPLSWVIIAGGVIEVVASYKEYLIRISGDEHCVFLCILEHMWQDGFTREMMNEKLVRPGSRCNTHSGVWECRHCKDDTCHISDEHIYEALESLAEKSIIKKQSGQYRLQPVLTPP